MTSTRELVADCDMHIFEPPDLWQRYIDPAWRHVAPVGLTEMQRDMRVRVKSHVLLRLGMVRPQSARSPAWKAETEGPYSAAERQGWSPDSQKDAMDAEGLDVAVLFPTRGLFVLGLDTPTIMGPDGLEPPFAAAIARGYNDWLHDFVRAHPDRFYGAGMIAPHDPEAAVLETRRCVEELGFRTVFLSPGTVNRRPWHHPACDPLWAECERLGVPIAFHGGGQNHLKPDFSLEVLDRLMMWHTFSQPLGIMTVAVSLTAGGVLERFPKLRVALLEGNCSWAPWLFYRLDEHYEWLGGWEAPDLTMKPSDYLRRNCWLSCEADEETVRHYLEVFGDDRLVFSTDYPHADSKFPKAVAAFRTLPIPAASQRKILWDNFSELYGIPAPPLTSYDVGVVGAGFGGLAAALRLAERGARVVVLETLRYPGGCASTFTRGGHRFESGATLFSGLGPGQLFARWIDRYGLDVHVDWIDPIAELRAPGLRLVVGRDREALVRQLEALPGCPTAALRRFLARQRRVADVLWTLLDDPSLLPPLEVGSLLRHALRAPSYLPLLGVVGRSLGTLLRADGLAGFAPLVTYLNALCQITVQCTADEAEAPFALGTMDYWYRGTAHVRGGIGNLAWGLVAAIRACGGEVRLASRVRRIERDGAAWRIVTRHGRVAVGQVVANLLPQNVARLLDDAPPSLAPLGAALDDGWGACMQYLVVRSDAVPSPDAHHVQVVQDPAAPFVEGNHFFCSMSDASEGERRVTVSTHVPLRRLRALPAERRGEYVGEIQARVRAGLRTHVPEWADAVAYELTASPRTFERFTGRANGCVGGIPRRRGLGHYLGMFPPSVAPGLHLVGDTMFPGQSTLAAALGGLRAADRVALASRPRLS